MATYVLNEATMFSDIADGIAIVINSETGIYYGMNTFGTNVFENILNGVSVEDTLAALAALPGAPEDMEARLNAFVGELLRYAIVIAGPSVSGAKAELDVSVAALDEFTLEVKEYTDAQELLLADPIHEVKDTTGWKPEKAALEDDEASLKAKNAKIGK